MTILITGITSIHGWPIYTYFKKCLGSAVFGTYPSKMKKHFTDTAQVFPCNIEDEKEVIKIFNTVNPDIIIHAGGVCDLDLCEEAPQLAHDINVSGARNIASQCKKRYCIYCSSDLVFSGTTKPAGEYNEDDLPDPITVVGRTQVDGETEIRKAPDYAIIRLALPIGDSLNGKKGAIDFINNRLKNNKKMSLFYDEIRSLITTKDLAKGIFLFVEKKLSGLFHFGGTNKYSLYDIGAHLVNKHDHDQEYLISLSRHEEENGPPRVGDVSMDSSKFYTATDFTPSPVWTQPL